MFEYVFRNLAFWFAMTTNQIERFGQKSICLVEDYSTNISGKSFVKISAMR